MNPYVLLHGDTLLGSFPQNENCIALAKAEDDYIWQFNESIMQCGVVFSFSNPKAFVRAFSLISKVISPKP